MPKRTDHFNMQQNFIQNFNNESQLFIVKKKSFGLYEKNTHIQDKI